MKPLFAVAGLLGASLASAQIGPNALPANASNVRFSAISQGADGTSNAAGLFVFNEPIAWGNYWRANHRGAPPTLEPGFFNNWRLVAIHVGTRPGDGYGLGVLGIRRRIDRATVSVVEVTPPRGARFRQASRVTTAPWILLRVERGAFDLDLQTQQVVGLPTVQTGGPSGGGATVVKVGGATVIFGPGYNGCP